MIKNSNKQYSWIMNFHLVGKFIIPTDEIIFFRGVGQPPTSDVYRGHVVETYQKKRESNLVRITTKIS